MRFGEGLVQCPVCKRYFEGAESSDIPPHGPVGHRCSGGAKVLTPDDVAKKLENAALRVWRIMMDARQNEDLYPALQNSQYTHSGALSGLMAELLAWEIKPMKRGYEDATG